MINGVIFYKKRPLKILFIISLLYNTNNPYSEVRLVIQGNGTQKILYPQFTAPSEVLVNGIKNNTCCKTCYVKRDKNNITLRFNNKITSCCNMFDNMLNMIEVDLSNFDFSKVETLNSMFVNCKNLKKIEFGNINTSSVTDMTSMFKSCNRLTSIDLSKFDTSNVVDMQSMFYGCSSLKYLDLSNFNTSKVKSINKMFEVCNSLIYLNLKYFKLDHSVTKDKTFNSISTYVTYCIEDQETREYLGINSNCSNYCFKDNIIIDFKNKKCTGNCSKYLYNNICYKECPNDTHPLFCYENNCENNVRECFDNPYEGYYLDIDNKTFKKCYEKCKYCYDEGNETFNNCIECKSNFTFLNYLNNTNCYEICDYYHYFDENNKYYCTINNTCPDDYNNLIEDKNQCIDDCKNDDEYKFNFENKCFKECPKNIYILIDDKLKICYNLTPEGYYLNITKKIYKKCYNTCKTCYGEGNVTINNCIE
mgnify:CR=1 FL=1